MARPHVPSLVAGVALLTFGVVLLLDASGVLELRFAGLAPLACAAVGTILLSAGLTQGE